MTTTIDTTAQTVNIPMPAANTKTVGAEAKESKSSFNSVFVSQMICRVADKPQTRSTTNGKAYTEIILAQNEDRNGQTNWITAIAWSNENIEKDVCVNTQNLKVGSIVQLKDVRIKANSWNYNNEQYYRMEAHLNSNLQIKFLALPQPKA